jgi:isoamylase
VREETAVMENPEPPTGCKLSDTRYARGWRRQLLSLLRGAAKVDLVLFNSVDDGRPLRTNPRDPAANDTYYYRHVVLPGIETGQIYGFRAYGPVETPWGLRFNPSKVLLDPYGRATVVPQNSGRDAASWKGDNAATATKSVVTDPRAYYWEGDVS